MSVPKHRANKLTKTEPRMQPAGRHVANRTLERLGAEAPDIRELMEAFVPPAWIRRMGR
jgi:hypothetical protein